MPETQPLTVKPLVCLFPAIFKQNLLSFIHHIRHILPPSTVHSLLESLKQDTQSNTWVTALVTQWKRQLDIDNEKPLFSAQCAKRLRDLSQRLDNTGKAGGWASCFQSVASAAPQSGSTLSEVRTQRKRNSSAITQDSDSEETSQKNKRIKVDLCGSEDVKPEQAKKEELINDVSTGVSAKALQPQPDMPCNTLPEHVKVAVLQLKDLLESQSEWDQSCTEMFKVLNDCNPAEVEEVCKMLNLTNVPEQTLPKLCSGVLALSPDLSYSTAAIFMKSLLLEKVLSLSEPASRCLVSAVTSLCSRYPRPVCYALIEHALEDENIGNFQVDLLNRLIGSCLDPHYRLLVLQMTFKIQWSEAVLSIIHCLLDSKLDLNEELFTQFTEQFVNQAPQLTKSVKFAKMLLTVLTKYSNNVTAAHKQTLCSCLSLNDTFLKKSLQAALKRITHIKIK